MKSFSGLHAGYAEFLFNMCRASACGYRGYSECAWRMILQKKAQRC